MDTACLEHRLTDEERETFRRDGYLVVPDVLPPERLARLAEVADRVEEEGRREQELGPLDRLSVMDFIGRDDLFVELCDLPTTIAKVWDILGWNIQIYHSHLVVTPPWEATGERDLALSWHQDSARMNQEMDVDPRPMISIKVAYFLSDCSEVDRGNFYVLPGSQFRNSIEFPEGGRKALIDGGVPVLAPAGSAVFFDRRVWHTASANYWTEARKVLFYGYSYRWLRPRDNVTMSHYWDRLDPIRKQLFGAAPTGGYGYTSPTDADVPLRTWIAEHVGPEAAAR
jgi:ectoine hydroxylase-related dioxygenase (phytanoyl-CoA dioxygenase family)